MFDIQVRQCGETRRCDLHESYLIRLFVLFGSFDNENLFKKEEI